MNPIAAARQLIIDANVTDLGLWRAVVTEWSVRGYNRGNIRGMLGWYAAGGPPPPNGHSANGNHVNSETGKVLDWFPDPGEDF